jgi:hypothetical protein
MTLSLTSGRAQSTSPTATKRGTRLPSRRNVVGLPCLAHGAVAIEQDRKGCRPPAKKRRTRLSASPTSTPIIVTVMQTGVQLLQGGQFGSAWFAPGRKKVHQHGARAQLREICAFAVERVAGEQRQLAFKASIQRLPRTSSRAKFARIAVSAKRKAAIHFG